MNKGQTNCRNTAHSGSGRADHGLGRHKWFDFALPMATGTHSNQALDGPSPCITTLTCSVSPSHLGFFFLLWTSHVLKFLQRNVSSESENCRTSQSGNIQSPNKTTSATIDFVVNLVPPTHFSPHICALVDHHALRLSECPLQNNRQTCSSVSCT